MAFCHPSWSGVVLILIFMCLKLDAFREAGAGAHRPTVLYAALASSMDGETGAGQGLVLCCFVVVLSSSWLEGLPLGDFVS